MPTGKHPWGLYVGTVALVLGLVFLFYGVPGVSSSGTYSLSTGQSLVVGVHYPLSLGSSATLTIAWNSPAYANVTVRACGTDSSCSHPSAVITAEGSGYSGRITFSGAKGSYFQITPSVPLTFTLTARIAYPFFYLALPFLVSGAGLWARGIILSPRIRYLYRDRKGRDDP